MSREKIAQLLALTRLAADAEERTALQDALAEFCAAATRLPLTTSDPPPTCAPQPATRTDVAAPSVHAAALLTAAPRTTGAWLAVTRVR